MPTNAIVETFPRYSNATGVSTLVSGREHVTAIKLIAGQTITSISFLSGSTAANAPTNQWFTLRSSARVLLGITNDDTTTAWAGTTVKTLNLTTPYVVPTTGTYYVGVMVKATTVPNMISLTGNSVLLGLAPILNGDDTTNTGLTTPATAPGTSAAYTNSTLVPYGYVS